MSGVPSPTPPQNSLMPPPVPVLSTTGVLHAGLLAELLGDGGREREDGRGADDADLVAGLGLGGECQKPGGSRGEEQTVHDASKGGNQPKPIHARWSRGLL